MFMQRFYDAQLAQASYLLGCARTGEAIVVDPNRSIDQYLAVADDEELRITAVTETHIHADFVSGARELAQRVGAKLYLSGEGGPDWQYAYAKADGAQLLFDGDLIRIGHLVLQTLHTPGHTPEHLSFLLTDGAVTDRPMAILSGDFVFVGDVGRPDLLEKAARIKGTMRESAHVLFHSLERFRALPDYLQLWPGHGAGSACGKSLGAVPFSTVGYERIANWGVGTLDEDEFVRMVLEGQPEPPAYFAEMKRINRDGPRVLGVAPKATRLGSDALPRALRDGLVVLDARPASQFAAGHVPGTINVPFNRSFTTWAGSLIPYDRDLLLIWGDGDPDEQVRDLAMIGLDRVVGYVCAGAVDEWATLGHALQVVHSASVDEANAQWRQGQVTVLDVRGATEWESGHVPGAVHIPLGDLAARLSELPNDQPVLVHCQSGSRSAIAASVLQLHGRTDVVDVHGGLTEWTRRGLVVERGASAVGAND
jgi:hydroxyacylglutathione hydrolase